MAFSPRRGDEKQIGQQDCPNNPVRKILDLTVSDNKPLTARFDSRLLNGVEVIKDLALNADKKEQDFTVIPYFAWANRGLREMTVWPERD